MPTVTQSGASYAIFNGGTITNALVASPANLDPGLLLKPAPGASSASDDTLEWYDDAGNILGFIDANGGISSTAKAGSTAGFAFTDPLGAEVSIETGSIAIEYAASGNFNVFGPSGNGEIQASTSGLGFFGTSPAAKPTVTGAKLPSDTVMASLLTALAALGLITNSTT